jgi:hypothetical protein
MAEFDQAVQNLERFIGLVMTATSAVGKVEDHVAANGRQFGDLEREAGEEGGGFNERLEELASMLETEEGEAVTALGELTQAGTTAQQDVAEVDTRVERAATDLDQAADAVETGLGQASTQLVDGGFEPFDQALAAAQQALETSSQEVEQSFTDLVSAVGAFESEAETAWNETGVELEESTTALVEAETAIEAEAQEGVQGFDAGADALETVCGTLVTDVDQIYDELDAGVAAQGQEWEQAVDAAAQEALAFLTEARQDRLEPAASMVDDEALATLNQEYETLATVLDAAATPLGELERLAVELGSAQTVVGQIDELMNALG